MPTGTRTSTGTGTDIDDVIVLEEATVDRFVVDKVALLFSVRVSIAPFSPPSPSFLPSPSPSPSPVSLSALSLLSPLLLSVKISPFLSSRTPICFSPLWVEFSNTDSQFSLLSLEASSTLFSRVRSISSSLSPSSITLFFFLSSMRFSLFISLTFINFSFFFSSLSFSTPPSLFFSFERVTFTISFNAFSFSFSFSLFFSLTKSFTTTTLLDLEMVTSMKSFSSSLSLSIIRFNFKRVPSSFLESSTLFVLFFPVILAFCDSFLPFLLPSFLSGNFSFF